MLPNKVIFWSGSEILKKLFNWNGTMCQNKLKYIVPEKFQMSEKRSYDSTSMTSDAYSFIPTINSAQVRNRRSGREESIQNYIPYPIYQSITPWNYYFRYPYLNHYPFHPNFYPLPFFNTAVQASYGRYFHRRLVDIEGRNVIHGKRNGDGIMSLRSWEKISKKPSNKPGFIFTLMSYNILAQDLLEQHPYLYQDNIREYLAWETRWNNLLKEISKFSPDILCLQEVQESHVGEYFSLLETLGYKGIYKKRTGNQSDGCAIYYKTDIVTLVENVFVEYFRPSVTVLNRDNVGILAKFVPKLHPTREFVVATTHLLYNPRRNDVRMAQMQLLLTEIEKISCSVGKENSSYAPVLLTGDLNSSPESDLYTFITKGQINKYQNILPRLLGGDSDSSIGKVLVTSPLGLTENSQPDELLETRQKDEEKNSDTLENSEIITEKQVKLAKTCYSNSNGVLSHNFYFKSVYSHGEPNKKEGTTYQDEWLTVDYIFYSMKNEKNEDKLQLLSKYRLPTKDELGKVRIPNKQLGSDHLSLLAKFKLEY